MKAKKRKVRISLNRGHGSAVMVSGVGRIAVDADPTEVTLAEHVVAELSRGSMFTIEPVPERKAAAKPTPPVAAEKE